MRSAVGFLLIYQEVWVCVGVTKQKTLKMKDYQKSILLHFCPEIYYL